MADTQFVLDVVAAVLLIAGSLLSLVAGVGLVILPDLLTRMHAAAKPQVLGLLLMLAGLAVVWKAWVWLPILVFAWALQMLTAPVAAHLVGRAGYRTKHVKRSLLYQDELADVVRTGRHTEATQPVTASSPARPAQPDDAAAAPRNDDAARR
ncbi:MAG: monovalent cation/H(+) antiporter subunit G [Micrococcus sp.]|nr:monovalent cation/H(+) antiporter subunit G [Micrococcus sp.]